tara:strand:+ start:3611 stop:4024 length:414 start_codon:yes stop_codon:yes gene_type:complete
MMSWSDLRALKTAKGNSICLHLSGKYTGQANPTFRNNYKVQRGNGTPRERRPKVVETVAEREARLIKEKADQAYREALATAEKDRLKLERSNERYQSGTDAPEPEPKPTKIVRKAIKFVPKQRTKSVHFAKWDGGNY